MVIGLIGFYYFNSYLTDENKRRIFELKRESSKNTIPHRLQAMERMTLFLERINPGSLLIRVKPYNDSKHDYENLLIRNIEQEFEHNLAQQIYVSNKCWNAIKATKNATISMIRQANMSEKVDSPEKDGDHIGPVVSEIQFNKIQTLIQKGIDEGAKLVAGGTGKPKGLEKGYYVKPTVFADVNNQMEIARTEIFGPVLSIIPFENEDEAISIANDTPYGLTNYIQTQDKEKVKRVARKLRSGMVDVNGVGIAVSSPFGGYKHSGIGREAGTEGLIEFLEVKTVGGWS